MIHITQERQQEAKLKFITDKEEELKSMLENTRNIYNQHIDKLRIPSEIKEKYFRKKSDINPPDLELVFDPEIGGGIIRESQNVPRFF
ncbi:unnamed protein product [Blepharisma stoltei]|uniref:Uncharacterized protein n=1 Tax=Blepharisma stoltei TaxID=1481888 RepID=A0AAU9K9D6_9CILI|nr:unnamed protein product [Blepharisma stoltei]